MSNELGRFDLAESWNRSRAFGINPSHADFDMIPAAELQERKNRLHEELFQYSTPILENLYSQLKNTPFMAIVSDAEGYIISTWGEAPFIDKAKAISLQSGVNWQEKRKGTNAIGTAIIERKPIQVIGEEHYVTENQFLTCYASPLYSATGELIGILDISGDVRFHHPHTLGMVTATAHACQSNILLNSVHHELVLSLKETDRIVGGARQPLISLSEEGVIKRINQQAAYLLKEKVEDCIGQPLSKWLDHELVQTLLSPKDKTSYQYDLRAHTKLDGNWIIEPIFDDRKKMYRVVMTGSNLLEHKMESTVFQNQSSKQINGPVTSCKKVQKTMQLALNVARTKATMLIRGETGTGKEVMAKEIHQASGRKGPLVVINCGAIPENLLEAELFGYEKGAFTGAKQEGYKGKFLAADQGTIFLDEIGEMPLTSQVVLLRVLEEKRVTPIGSNQSIPIDVRIIAATHRDLKKEIAKNNFRADLYYRLCELEIVLPPLRDREDLFDLVFHFIREIEQELNIPERVYLDETAMHALRQHNWPGNIRELRHAVRQAIYHMLYSRNSFHLTKDDFVLGDSQDATSKLEGMSIEQSEQEAIAKAIQLAEGNLTKAATMLKMGRTTLYRKIHQYPHLKELRDNY